MVVGGYGTNAYNDVEFVDLSGNNRTCRAVSDYEEAKYCSIGTFIDDKILVCGGTATGDAQPSEFQDSCFNYFPDDDSWVQTTNMLVKLHNYFMK